MPAPPFANSFEGGSDTTAITAGNSGGASGSAFDVVFGTTTYSATHPARGVMGSKYDHTAANAQSYVRWQTLGSITTDVYWRAYAWLDTIPASGWKHVVCNDAATALCAQWSISSTGHTQIINAAGVGIGVGTGTAWTGASTVRLEGHIIPKTSNGTLEMRMWLDPASTGAADDTVSSTTAVLGANVERFSFGLPEFGTGYTFDPWMDEIALTTVGWIGPVTTPLLVPSTYPATQFGPF